MIEAALKAKKHPRFPVKRIRAIVAVMLAVLFIGTMGYHFIMHFNILDSLYMTVITLSTVGFGEIKPFTPAGQIFTIFLILVGVGILTFAVESIMEIWLDPDVAGFFRDAANTRKVKKMENHYIICGLGRVGSHVAEEMFREGVPFACVERDPEQAKAHRDRNWVVIEGDATDDAILYKAGIEKAKAIICVMDSDVNNLYVTISARGIRNDLTIITRAVEDGNIKKFKKAGATQVISPYTMLGKRIVRSVLKPSVDTLVDQALNRPEYDFHLEELLMDDHCSTICGKSIKESGIKAKTGGASIISILKQDKSVHNNPDPDEIIEKGDILIVIGTSEQLKKFRDEIG